MDVIKAIWETTITHNAILYHKNRYRNACTIFSPVDNKRNFKDKKFGFGGKKKGGKLNTKQSVNDVTGYKPFRANPKGGKGKMAKKKRLGKERRQKAKPKKK